MIQRATIHDTHLPANMLAVAVATTEGRSRCLANAPTRIVGASRRPTSMSWHVAGVGVTTLSMVKRYGTDKMLIRRLRLRTRQEQAEEDARVARMRSHRWRRWVLRRGTSDIQYRQLIT